MQTEQLKQLAIDSLEDLKALDVVILDVREKTSVTDFMVIASGSSNRHVEAVAENVRATAKQKGAITSGAKGRTASDWVLIDLGDVLVHVMTEQARHFYDLESLWGDSEPTASEQ